MKRLVATLDPNAFDATDRLRIPYPPYDVLVVKCGDDVFAIEDSCNHAGASLEGGDVESKQIRCPAHGYAFSLETGALIEPVGLCGPQRVYSIVRREDGAIEIWDEPVLTLAIPEPSR